MNKYHLNAEGEPGQCRATKGNCPFGSASEHYNTKEEARKGFEEKTKITLEALKIAQTNLQLVEDQVKKFNFQFKAVKKRILENTTAALESDLQKLASMEEKQHELIRATRHAWYAQELALQDIDKLGLTESIGKINRETQASKDSNQQYLRTMKINVDLNNFNAYYKESLVAEYAGWAEISRSEARRAIDNYENFHSENPDFMSKEEYIIRLFQDNLPKEKERVFLDLETSGFHPSSGEIIEIGIVRMDAKGNIIEEIKERYDLEDATIREKLGVGPSHIHKIYSEDLVGKKSFQDPEVQERIGKILNNPTAVLIAHNKNFENEFLNHYLKGYRDTHDTEAAKNIVSEGVEGNMNDTRALSGFLIDSIPNNKLESFSQANGVPYANAHTAIDDARMTGIAFYNFVENMKNSKKGARPFLTWEGMPEPKTK